MTIIGISGLYHDSAAAVVSEGRILAAAQEERFTRLKGDRRWPVSSIEYCLSECQTAPSWAAFYEDPRAKFDRIVRSAASNFPESMELWEKAIASQLSDKNSVRHLLTSIGPSPERCVFVNHHVSHAASAFYPSPFETAAILVVDAVGECSTTSIFRGNGKELELQKKIDFPHSLGLLYSAFTYYCGFKVNSGEYKLMGLAPFGEPIYEKTIRENLIAVCGDGSFALNMDYFDYGKRDALFGEKFCELLGQDRRDPEARLTPHYANVAASIQKVFEDVMLRLAVTATAIAGSKNLCLAGGSALNCVANAKIRDLPEIENAWVQPAAGDAGGALGAAMFVEHNVLELPRKTEPTRLVRQGASYWGPEYSRSQIKNALEEQDLKSHEFESREEHHKVVAQALSKGLIVGRFHGRMEYGPRALGARSIIADPRIDDGQKTINLKIKFRESWRPFAPAVLGDFEDECFEPAGFDPYMLFTKRVKGFAPKEVEDSENKELDYVTLLAQKISKSSLPSITHVDGSARVQSVDRVLHEDFYAQIDAFREITDCPVLVNTSFNVRGEPIVCSPQDAIKCFLNTHLDVLSIGDFVVFKEELTTQQRQLAGKVRFDD